MSHIEREREGVNCNNAVCSLHMRVSTHTCVCGRGCASFLFTVYEEGSVRTRWVSPQLLWGILSVLVCFSIECGSEQLLCFFLYVKGSGKKI